MSKTLLVRWLCKVATRSYSYKAVKRPDFSKIGVRSKTPILENKEYPTIDLLNNLKAKILATGPMTVADYMKEVLTNPIAGYYMHRDVFGNKGDFITSPEISQIFGELVAVWIVNEWNKLGAQKPFQLVEFGPGRGTLARDVLKVFSRFQMSNLFSIHFVEISEFLSNLQAEKICFKNEFIENKPFYRKGKTAAGTEVFWYKRIEDVPNEEFSIYLAHEFFDALPIHKLQLVEGNWKEILIDCNDKKMKDDDASDFRFVLSNAKTPISQIFVPLENEKRETLEYSIESERIIRILAERIEKSGGIALIMDYGHFGDKSDTFRAFREHKLHDPLKDPGLADLTADVDFLHLKRTAEKQADVICLGPVEQGAFLKKMEGEARLENLLENALPENKATIESGYKMLTESSQMGARFKFFSIFPAVVKEHLEKFPVAGFH